MPEHKVRPLLVDNFHVSWDLNSRKIGPSIFFAVDVLQKYCTKKVVANNDHNAPAVRDGYPLQEQSLMPVVGARCCSPERLAFKGTGSGDLSSVLGCAELGNSWTKYATIM